MDVDFEKALNELNERTDTRCLDVEAIRDRIKLRPDILFTRVDDEFIIRFLRSRKYDKDKAFQLLVNYNQFRRKHFIFFKTLNISCLRPVFEDGLPTVSPLRDHLGRSLIFLFAGNWNSVLYTFDDILRALFVTMEYLIESERTQLFGVVLVVDFTGWKFADAQKLNKQHLIDAIKMFQDCFPARFKAIHFINQPWYVRVMLTLIKSTLKEKTISRIYFHGKNLFELQNYIKADALPRELGGDLLITDKSWLYKALLEKEVFKGKSERKKIL
ncbi:clavesin-1 [Hydra vulgaris]|uniref:Clavesin-2 n=1 Tax=Hydra vulgaris TaxID=6087 RepID=T2MCI8_HYDVU|nr:clavesin-1 [Hydra vulgaris]